MKRKFFSILGMLMIAVGWTADSSAQNQKIKPQKQRPMTIEAIKLAVQGEWNSIATEIRPSKSPEGTLKPLYLSRHFVLTTDDIFELTVTTYGDPYGKLALAKMYIKGHIQWKGEHPIAEGAQRVDFTADLDYAVTPLHQGFVDLLNSVTKGYSPWKLGEAQSILKKAFAPFGLAEGQLFKEFDLVYLRDELMFWGARNVDGRGFDTEENRPTNLQIPLIRKK